MRLQDRETDRVFLEVVLRPNGGPISLDGVAVEWCTRDREPLSPRHLLPISGTLAGPLSTTVELRCHRTVPNESVVVGTAWWGKNQREFICPADPETELESHVKGTRLVLPLPEKTHEMYNLSRSEWRAIVSVFPWVKGRRTPDEDLEETEEIDTTALMDEITADYGLDEDSAQWLKELLFEDEGPLPPTPKIAKDG